VFALSVKRFSKTRPIPIPSAKTAIAVS
jgi:hypothetical protein